MNLIQKVTAIALAAFILGAAFVTEARDRIGIIGDNDGRGDHIGWDERDGRDGRWDRDDRDRRDRRDREDRRDRRRPREEVKSVFLNRSFYRESLNLNYLFQLDRERGSEVIELEVVALNADRSLISLSADGRIVASTTSYSGRNLLVPRSQLEIGRDFNRLNLDLTGSIYIQEVRITLAHRGSGPGQSFYIEGSLYQHVRDGQIIDLNRLMRLDQYRGYKIAEIEVQGQSTGPFMTTVHFLVNHYREAQASLIPGQSARLFLRQPVEIRWDTLSLQLQGSANIDRIRILLQRR